MVLIGHIGQAIPGARIFTPLGATGVGVFLLCSGYGIEKSYTKNGRKHYWYKRLINVWLPYVIIELLVWMVGLSSRLSFMDLFLIHPLHPFGWYMRYLFVWYILYYVYSFAGKYRLHLLLASSVVAWLVLDTLHAQNAFSFAIGVGLAKMTSIQALLKKRYVLFGVVSCAILFVTRDYIKNHYYEIHLLWNTISLAFYLALTLTSVIGYKVLSNASVKIPYTGLYWVGIFSYELYLVHGYAYQVLIAPASILMVSEFLVVCVVGSYILYKFNHLNIRLINKYSTI